MIRPETRSQFRFIFNPGVTTALSRVTPVHNYVDDVTFVKGNHTLQFGGNVRLIKNSRVSFGNAFDTLTTNPSGYAASAAVLTSAGADASGGAIFPDVAGSSLTPLRNALSAVIGRVLSIHCKPQLRSNRKTPARRDPLQIELLRLRNMSCTGRISGACVRI